MNDWEPELIELWNQGVETEEIARRWGIPRGTVQSRAHRLQVQGKIQPRARGGNYPRQKALARQEGTPAPPAMTFVAVPEIQEMLSILKDLQARVGELEQSRVPPAIPAPPAPQVPPADPSAPAPTAPERKDVQQWTVRLSKALIKHVKAVAYERRINPSEVVETCLWAALREPSA